MIAHFDTKQFFVPRPTLTNQRIICRRNFFGSVFCFFFCLTKIIVNSVHCHSGCQSLPRNVIMMSFNEELSVVTLPQSLNQYQHINLSRSLSISLSLSFYFGEPDVINYYSLWFSGNVTIAFYSFNKLICCVLSVRTLFALICEDEAISLSSGRVILFGFMLNACF